MGCKKMIIDTDAGTDDALAILMALEAEKQGETQVVAITCVNGNTKIDNVCQNVLRILKLVGRLEIPVYRGADSPLVVPYVHPRAPYHGSDGFGDAQWPEAAPDSSLIQKEHAADALLRLARENPGELTLLLLGPLTNVALAMKLDPNFTSQLKNIYVMGGNVEGFGNIEIAREFNFCCDPESAYVFLQNLKTPTYVIPWELCLKYVSLPYEWRVDVLGTIDTPQAALMNRIEGLIMNRKINPCWIPCDQTAMAIALDADVVTESVSRHVTVELHGCMTRGQMLVDHNKHLGKPDNVIIVQKVDLEKVKQRLKWAVSFCRS